MASRTAKTTVWAIMCLLAVVLTVLPAGGNMAPGEFPAAVDSNDLSLEGGDWEGRRLAWSYFKALAEREDVMIIDVRSGFLPAGDLPGLELARPIPLEIFLPNFVARKVHQDKTLLIFDESGQELPRLQFNLQKHGYDDYFFLEGGATGALIRPDDRS